MTGNSGFETGFNMGNQNITITGRLVGSGRDLVAVIDNTYFDNSMRKGG
jgi:NAD/NADP transhydrogenase beta subunit